MKKLIGLLTALLVIGSLVAIAGDKPADRFYSGCSQMTSACDLRI